jgi:arylsulfatase
MDNQPLNVLLILTDQLRHDALGCAGNPVVETPNLDRLAEQGIRFTNAYTDVPVCMAARAALMTGQQGHRINALDNNVGSMEDRPTVAGTLRDGGYSTFAVGKMHTRPLRSSLGFDRVMLSEGQVAHLWDDDYALFLHAHGYPHEREPHGVGNPGAAGPGLYYKPETLARPEEHTTTAWTADRTIDYLELNRDRRFFCYTSFVKPHPPFHPPIPYDRHYDPANVDLPIGWGMPVDDTDPALDAQDRFKIGAGKTEAEIRQIRASYYGLVTQIDHHVGRILDTLERLGLRDRTVVIFSSDHGELLGDHGHWGKRCFYDSSAKVPFIVSCPGRFEIGRVDRRLVSLADVFPTLADLAHVPTPPGLSGSSIVPLLLDPSAPGKDWQLAEFTGFVGIIDTPDRRMLARFMVRWGDWKYNYFANGGREQLFNLREDPNELRSVASEQPKLCADVRTHMAGYFRQEEATAFLDSDGSTLLHLPFQGYFHEVLPTPR